VNYIPLFGRWPTLLLVAAIAVAATVLSFHIDGTHRHEHANPSETTDRIATEGRQWATSEGVQGEGSAPNKIIVVNPDGSVRDSSAGFSRSDVAGDVPFGDSPRDEAYENMEGDGGPRFKPARRIE
jgi:hypothetical protein